MDKGLLVLCVVPWWLSEAAGPECIYEGSFSRGDLWQPVGWITSQPDHGDRMQFDVSYPAELCCASLLFYTDTDMTRIHSENMNCSQKVGILLPEHNTQILLSTSYPWSGCQASGSSLRCEGGRTMRSATKRKWGLALSSCDQGMAGLTYKLNVTQDGPCGADPEWGVSPAVPTEAPPDIREEYYTCTFNGTIADNDTWVSIGHVGLDPAVDSSLRFEFSYDSRLCCASFLIYTSSDVIKPNMTCEERVGLLAPEQASNVLLYPVNIWSGCKLEDSTYICKGGRSMRPNVKADWTLAVSNCDQSLAGLSYRLEFTQAEPCKPQNPTTSTGPRSLVDLCCLCVLQLVLFHIIHGATDSHKY